VANQAEGAWGQFIAPKGNLPVGASETRTCPITISETRPWHTHVQWWGLTRVKARRREMSGQGTGYVQKILLEHGYMVG
jgi:hypothetical protein